MIVNGVISYGAKFRSTATAAEQRGQCNCSGSATATEAEQRVCNPKGAL